MKNVFTKANKKRKSLKGHFPEADIIDMVEEVCEDKFERYSKVETQIKTHI